MQVVQGTLSETIPCQCERAAGPVENTERERPIQALERARAPGDPGVEQHLRIRGGGESKAEIDQLLAQLAIVVDLPIEGDPVAAEGVAEGLLTRLDIHDAQTRGADRDRVIEVVTHLVGAAMLDVRKHALQALHARPGGLSRAIESCNPAHRNAPRPDFDAPKRPAGLTPAGYCPGNP